MIKDHIEFQVGKMKVDVNWSKEVIPCKQIRFQFGDHVEIIDHDELYSLLMLFGNDHQQDKLIPVKKTEMVLIERMLHIKTKKTMKAGEILTVPYRYSLTKEGYEEELKKNPRSFRIVENVSTDDVQSQKDATMNSAL